MAIHILSARPPLIQMGMGSIAARVIRSQLRPPGAVNALIDTGASVTPFHPRLIDQFRPLRVGEVDFQQPDGAVSSADIYQVRLCFEPILSDIHWPLKVRWFEVAAVAVAPATPGVDVLIGQDLLASLVLTWDGPRSRVLLMY